MKIKTVIQMLLITTFFASCSLFWTPDSVEIGNSEQTVKDARKIIQNFRGKIIEQYGENTKTAHSFFEPDEKGGKYHEPVNDFPDSLKIKGLRYGYVCYDHIDLIFSRNPDNEDGLRIWSEDAKQLHKDKPTKYTDIFGSHYNNDSPVSASNIP
jgi:hypothetical protein